jgi:hypothetical protein
MNTTDHFLIDIYSFGINRLNSKIPPRDKKILTSLAKQIGMGHFLTENQSKLLVKILRENKPLLVEFSADQLLLIENPTWSEKFRVIEQIRKIFISKEHEPKLIIEFTYNKRLRQEISNLGNKIQGQLSSINSKQYSVPLTELNLYHVVETFKNQGFLIDQNLTKFYEEISEILKTNVDQFNVFNLSNEKIIKKIQDDIGPISTDNLLLLNDRKFKFQYTISEKSTGDSLANTIANRSTPKVWINSSTTDLDVLIKSLIELKRLPVLLIFNGHESKECLENLKKIHESLLKNNVTDKVGIYFRFDNVSDSNKSFNNYIQTNNLNYELHDDTQIAGIVNNKLPKFLIKSNWYPKSVISFSNNYKNNKTSVYGSGVDLVIFYNDKKPLNGGIDALL